MTGAAIRIASCLLCSSLPSGGGRLLVFCGGPCTTGVGRIVPLPLEQPIRSHKDLSERPLNPVNTIMSTVGSGSGDSCDELYEAATSFYAEISKELVTSGHVMDVFAGALDQGAMHQRLNSQRRSRSFINRYLTSFVLLLLSRCFIELVGIAEMKSAVMRTGGVAILTETFAHDIFKKVITNVTIIITITVVIIAVIRKLITVNDSSSFIHMHFNRI